MVPRPHAKLDLPKINLGKGRGNFGGRFSSAGSTPQEVGLHLILGKPSPIAGLFERDHCRGGQLPHSPLDAVIIDVAASAGPRRRFPGQVDDPALVAVSCAYLPRGRGELGDLTLQEAVLRRHSFLQLAGNRTRMNTWMDMNG